MWVVWVLDVSRAFFGPNRVKRRQIRLLFKIYHTYGSCLTLLSGRRLLYTHWLLGDVVGVRDIPWLTANLVASWFV